MSFHIEAMIKQFILLELTLFTEFNRKISNYILALY